MAIFDAGIDDARLKLVAMEYVNHVRHQIATENAAADLGTQNQAVDFILSEPRLKEAVARWAAAQEPFEARVAPPQVAPADALEQAVADFLRGRMAPAKP